MLKLVIAVGLLLSVLTSAERPAHVIVIGRPHQHELANVKPKSGPGLRAVALMTTGGRGVYGVLQFDQADQHSPVRLTGVIYGLPTGFHGFHVHEFGDFTNRCDSTGGHYNPFRMRHGAPNEPIRHVGDLGNIEADENGQAVIDITDYGISLFGPYTIFGRAIVVHSSEDDLGRGLSAQSLITGNSGTRIGCGVIALANSENKKH